MLNYQGVYIYILVVWNMCILFHILGIVIPIDFHLFRGVGIPPTRYIYMCVFYIFNIDGIISKQMIQYKLYILLIFSDFGGYETIGGNCFFFGIWICCCHPGFTLCILQRGQLTPSIQLICCMGVYI